MSSGTSAVKQRRSPSPAAKKRTTAAATTKTTHFGLTEITKGKGWWGRPNVLNHEKQPWEVIGSKLFSWNTVIVLWVVIPGLIVFVAAKMPLSIISVIVWAVTVAILFLPIMGLSLKIHSEMCVVESPVDQSCIDFVDQKFEKKWKGKKIPIITLYEAYFDQKVTFKKDLLDCLYSRYDYSKMILTFGHLRYFVFQMIPELLNHSKAQDETQVTDHYDRGNDFYAAFLGEAMVYTSGIFKNENDSLVTAQYNKLDGVFNKVCCSIPLSFLSIRLNLPFFPLLVCQTKTITHYSHL